MFICIVYCVEHFVTYVYLSNCIECVNCPNQVELAVVLNFKMAEGGYIGTGPFFSTAKTCGLRNGLKFLKPGLL